MSFVGALPASLGVYGLTKFAVTLTETDIVRTIDYTRKQLRLKTIDIVKSVDKRKVNPLKAVSELAILRDWLVKKFIISLFERVYGEHWGIGYRGKILRDSFKGIDSITSIASFLRTLYDAGKTSEYTVKNPSKRLADTGKTMDILKKSTSLLRLDSIKSIDYMCKLPSLKELDTIKGVDTHTIAPAKVLYELSIPCDRLSKSLGKALLDRVFGEWVYESLRGKVLRDTVKAVEVLSKTSILHREYFDAFMGSDRAFREFIKPVSDLLRTSDRLYKSILKVFEAESSIVGVPFKEMAREARDTVKALEVLFTKDIVWDFIEKVIAKERPRKEVLAYFFDTLSTEYVMAKGIPRVVREAVKGVDIASKELATSFSDLFKVKDIGAWWTFIKQLYERIFSEHDYVRSSVKVYRDYSRFTDPIAKIAFTLTQLWTRRVYSRPEKFADIIEASDHNVRVDACKKLLDKIKKLKEKLESM